MALNPGSMMVLEDLDGVRITVDQRERERKAALAEFFAAERRNLTAYLHRRAQALSEPAAAFEDYLKRKEQGPQEKPES